MSHPSTPDQPTFFDAPDTFVSDHHPDNNSDHSVSLSTLSSLQPINNNNNIISKPPHQSDSHPLPPTTTLRRRRLFSRHNLKDFKILDSNLSLPKKHSFLSSLKNLKDGYQLNDELKDGYELNDELSGNNLDLNDEVDVNDGSRSVTVDSPVSGSGSGLGLMLGRILLKVILLQASLLVSFVTFPVWLIHSFYVFVTEPFAMMRRVRRYAVKRVSRFLSYCFGKVKWVVYKWFRRNKLVWKLGMRVGWGVMSAVLVGVVLVGLFCFAFVVGGAIMRCVMEVPVRRIEQLNFDYTVDSPVAFMAIPSCPESFYLEGNGLVEFGEVALSRVIPPDHKLQATVLLTLPESDYNRNLGNFQVRVDFLSSNGKSLSSAAQPCAMRFKSWPIRLFMTVFKLAPLLTGYSSESQTLDIKFNGYTEREIPTCCVRVVLEPLAEFAKGGGVPEIYTAYLKLESQLPFFKRILWSWKATIFVWTSIMIFSTGLAFMLLCCTPWLRLRDDSPLNNTGSR